MPVNHRNHAGGMRNRVSAIGLGSDAQPEIRVGADDTHGSRVGESRVEPHHTHGFPGIDEQAEQLRQFVVGHRVSVARRTMRERIEHRVAQAFPDLHGTIENVKHLAGLLVEGVAGMDERELLPVLEVPLVAHRIKQLGNAVDDIAESERRDVEFKPDRSPGYPRGFRKRKFQMHAADRQMAAALHRCRHPAVLLRGVDLLKQFKLPVFRVIGLAALLAEHEALQQRGCSAMLASATGRGVPLDGE